MVAAQTELTFEDLAERNFIGGEWRFTREGYGYDIYDPSESTVIAAVPLSTHRDVAQALAAARVGLATWAAMEGDERARVVWSALAHLDRDIERVASVIARDTGLPAAMARAELRAAIGAIREKLGGAGETSAAPGIIGQISSWSNPLVASLRLAALDLVRGDVVIVHPSLKAPLSLVCLAEAMSRAGAPAGVFNLVQGAGIDVGAALARSKDLKRLDFQGSRATARSVRRSPDRHGIPVQEIFRRVERRTLASSGELESFAAVVAASALAHATRVGFGGLEVRVPRASLDALVDALRPALASVGYTDDAPGGRTVAPFAAERFRDAAEAQLDAWLDCGARLLLRAPQPDQRTRRMGWFVPPCVALDAGDQIALDPEVPTGPLVLVKTL